MIGYIGDHGILLNGMQISEQTKIYWKPEDWNDVAQAYTMADLYTVACRIIDRMPQGSIIELCGPIGTGGRGSVGANLKYFNETIKLLQTQGLIVFDQMPFEDTIQKLKATVTVESILSDFYLPLIESGKIATLYFMKEWQSSKGATWEHEQAMRLSIPIVYL